MAKRIQSYNEEIANSVTHALGILFTLVAMPLLILYAIKNSSVSIVWAVSVFGFGMLMVYLSSTLYHSAQKTNTKRILQVWDHISIFVMIAGSYTPLVVTYLDRKTAIIFLSIMWAFVALGSFMKIFFTGKYNIVSVIIYLALGWMAVFIIKPLIASMPMHIFWMILVSGLAYTLGVIFYLWKKLEYHHAVWHVFVLTGTVAHFFAVYNSIPINIKV